MYSHLPLDESRAGERPTSLDLIDILHYIMVKLHFALKAGQNVFLMV